jgi:penicillin-binding protein 1C
LNRKLRIALALAGAILLPVMIVPVPRAGAPLSTVVEAADGTLLGARIADDGQWRFPFSGSVPEKFEKAILTAEDRWFYYHPGINPVSVMRAFVSNLKARRTVSGGSTITMQVARILRGNRPRRYGEKFIEMLLALKLELFRSKKVILGMYAANAPFGGNSVGLEAASWRWAAKPPDELTWSEAAAFAILPNSPALVFPGRNQEILKSRRDALLRKLHERKFIDSITLVLAVEEPLPGDPKPLPSSASHLTDMYYMKSRGKRIRTTIDPVLQKKAVEIINNHQKILSLNFIFNAACLIVSADSGHVLAYVGNSSTDSAQDHSGDVDIIMSLRSSGSILKPFLYAAMQESGDILPNTLIPDIPTRFPGFSPKNFDRTYNGAVPASSALSQSLNIPAVRMLQQYNTEKFLDLLKGTGFTSLNRTADHYGLSLILGGGETSLWELTGAYASLARVLNRYMRDKQYSSGDYHPPRLQSDYKDADGKTQASPPLYSASSLWLTMEALRKVNRPESESGWQYFSSSPALAWKTGTSFGFRDAWAVGTTPDYVIGVWAGNADGEGRPGLTGISAGAPILFDLVSLMGSGVWFEPPHEEMTMVRVCSRSGYRAGPDCPETEEISVSLNGLRSGVCPYHRIVHLNRSRTRQVTTACVDLPEIINESWFVLPPAMEYFYKQKNPGYKVLPPPAPGCTDDKSIPAMEFIYPTQGVRIFIPRDQTGNQTRIIPEIAHRNPSKKIFWHLNQTYVGTTRLIHQAEIIAGAGSHVITAVDEDGNTISCSFTIAGRTN